MEFLKSDTPGKIITHNSSYESVIYYSSSQISLSIAL